MRQTLSNVVALPDLHFYWCLRPVSFIVIIVRSIFCVVSPIVSFFNHICEGRGSPISWNNGTIRPPALGKTAHSKLVMLVLRTENSYALSYMCSDPKVQ